MGEGAADNAGDAGQACFSLSLSLSLSLVCVCVSDCLPVCLPACLCLSVCLCVHTHTHTMQVMQDKRVVPNVITYSIAISAVARSA